MKYLNNQNNTDLKVLRVFFSTWDQVILHFYILGNALEKCSDWLTDNKLSLHLGKTECMLAGPKRKIRQIKYCLEIQTGLYLLDMTQTNLLTVHP
jgi:hypothetical protein